MDRLCSDLQSLVRAGEDGFEANDLETCVWSVLPDFHLQGPRDDPVI